MKVCILIIRFKSAEGHLVSENIEIFKNRDEAIHKQIKLDEAFYGLNVEQQIEIIVEEREINVD